MKIPCDYSQKEIYYRNLDGHRKYVCPNRPNATIDTVKNSDNQGSKNVSHDDIVSGGKRKQSPELIQKKSRKAKVYIFDIEGTTTSISFVTQTLFPYARNNVEKYLEDHFESQMELCEEIWNVMNLSDVDSLKKDKETGIRKIVDWVHGCMDTDSKHPSLKKLQGNIFLQAYENGLIKGHVYKDAYDALQELKKDALLYVYSSGSVNAQKLLFQYSEYGDMTSLFEDHFDTNNVGSKVEKESYKIIFEKVSSKHPDIQKEDVVFVTDNILEANAARDYGILSVLSIREGTMELPEDHKYQTIHSFSEL